MLLLVTCPSVLLGQSKCLGALLPYWSKYRSLGHCSRQFGPSISEHCLVNGLCVLMHSSQGGESVCVCTTFSCRKQGWLQEEQPVTGKKVNVSRSNTVWISHNYTVTESVAWDPVPLGWCWAVFIFPRILDNVPVTYISCLHNWTQRSQPCNNSNTNCKLQTN